MAKKKPAELPGHRGIMPKLAELPGAVLSAALEIAAERDLLIPDAAARKGVSRATLQAWIRDGALPSYLDTQGRRRVTWADLEAVERGTIGRPWRGRPAKSR